MRETPPDASRHLASLYSPPSERPLLAALCAVEKEIVASLQSELDHTVAHARLQWWREECSRVAKGNPVHPLTRTLMTEFAGRPADPLAGISGFVDVAVWDLAAATFETRRELTAYCERWATAMMMPAVAHAAPQLEEAPSWLAIGSAMREIELLTHLARDARSGRLRLPLDELERAGLAPESLAVTPCSPALAALLGKRHAELRSILADSVARIERKTQPALRGLLAWAAIAWHRSEQAQRALPDAQRPRRLDALAEAWRAWRAARHAMAGRASLA
jgi:phytoene synthase